ncbi:MAG: Asp-tRNA(Asn)/Glu-tRNA(Gln) amidotransferase GatCAB subunit B, partial [Acidobacteriota bacterium]
MRGSISGKMAKEVFHAMATGGGPPEKVIRERGLALVSDESRLRSVIQEVLGRSAAQVAQYQAGKTKVMGYFVGQVMQATRGQASPQVVNRLLAEALKGSGSRPSGS